MKNKNILFSVDGIIGYREEIEEVLKKKFKIVKYIDHYIPPREKRSIFFKILREFSKRFKSSFIHKYFNSIVRDYYMKHILNFTEKIDYFFVIAGREFSKEFIQDLKKKNPGIVCIIFLWDKLEYTTLRNSIEEFDYVFSFDPEDCKKYNFIFRPSFTYISPNNIVEYNERKYDFSYIGALRDEYRYQIVSNIFDVLGNLKKKIYIHLFKSKKEKISFYYEPTLVKDYKIAYQENLNVIKNSKVILDIPFGKQKGVTLRVSESLQLEVKLITTNEDIKKYDFYNPKNIKVVQNLEDILRIEPDFFEEQYVKISPEIVEKYTVEGFIKSVFNRVFWEENYENIRYYSSMEKI